MPRAGRLFFGVNLDILSRRLLFLLSLRLLPKPALLPGLLLLNEEFPLLALLPKEAFPLLPLPPKEALLLLPDGRRLSKPLR